MRFTDIRRYAALATLFATLSGAAHGQYLWIDEKGRKQYSDMPPPATVPANRVLKQPGSRPAAPEPVTEPEAQARAAALEPSLAEKDADFRKRRAERAEKDKKAAEEARLAVDKQKYCERNRGYRKTLETGVRIASTDKKGERTFLSDEERAREVSEVNRALKDCK